jgi:bifunctional UDP-N-acetylglucosamine pyrophosphorylase/glucosamine-1-phosphate N-acetyltransferase
MYKKIKAIILAAGKGTRMKSSLPKVLHNILGKSLIERVINSVIKLDCITETIVITGHKSELIEEFLKKIYKEELKISTVIQEPQNGTGHAVFQAWDKLKDFNGTVIVLCGDTPLLSTKVLSEFIEFHRKSEACLTVMSAIFDNPFNYGRIIRGLEGNIEKIVEEKDANPEQKKVKEINAGVYCFEWQKISQAFFEIKNNNSQGEYYLTDIVDWCVKRGIKSCVYKIKNNYEIFGINSRAHLAQAVKTLSQITIQQLMDEGVTIISPENTLISPETFVGEDSIIYPGCIFEGENYFGQNCVLGPDLYVGGNVKTEDNVKIFQSKISNAIIGSNSTVGPFSHLRDSVNVSSNVRIGNFVEIKNSTIGHSTNISHLGYVGDALLGSYVNIGAGTITANYDALSKIKNRTIIEDGVKIGSNCVLVAPVTIKNMANVAAGSVITKDVPEYALAIAREKQQILDKWVEKKLNKFHKATKN